jgi:hypothetical protein
VVGILVSRRVARIKFLVCEGTSRERRPDSGCKNCEKKKKKKTSQTLLLPPKKMPGNTFFSVFLYRCFAAFESSDCLLDRASRRCCFCYCRRGINPSRNTSVTRYYHSTTCATGSLKVTKRVGLSHWPRKCATANNLEYIPLVHGGRRSAMLQLCTAHGA